MAARRAGLRGSGQALMQWREERVQGRGVQLHVRRVVDPVAPPVLLLHGLGVGGSIWQAFARRLLPDLAAIAPDLRGHGQSDAPPVGYTPTDYANDLLEVLRAEGAMPVVGHSLGALVALRMAELQSKLVPWLVVLDPPLDPALRNPEVESVYRLRHAAAGELETYLLSRNPGGGALLAESLAKLFCQASDGAFEAMLAAWPFEAPSVEQPVLVLQADPAHGGILGDAAAQAFVKRLPHGQLQKIHGATHALHASHPAQVAQAILEFSRTAQAGRGAESN
jgi:pimeloyl-ACP methyl ester carboxylesterase